MIDIKNKKLAITAMLITISVIFGYIESLFYFPIYIPGIKLGLGNIVILISLFNLDNKTTWLIMLLKVIITSLLFSPFTTFVYSLCGGVVSLFFMLTAKKINFNMITISIIGGITHNIAQLFSASILLKNINVFYYLPALILAGIIVALITGSLALIINKRIKNIN